MNAPAQGSSCVQSQCSAVRSLYGAPSTKEEEFDLPSNHSASRPASTSPLPPTITPTTADSIRPKSLSDDPHESLSRLSSQRDVA